VHDDDHFSTLSYKTFQIVAANIGRIVGDTSRGGTTGRGEGYRFDIISFAFKEIGDRFPAFALMPCAGDKKDSRFGSWHLGRD
jgi:putative lipase involved disintegration of autophagic bodies